MSNYVQLDVWFQEDKLSALSSVLVEQGTTVEKRMQGVLLDMYEALVPRETQEAIRTRLDKEEAEARAAEEAARKYTAFCVRVVLPAGQDGGYPGDRQVPAPVSA